MKKKVRSLVKCIVILLTVALSICLIYYLLQRFWAHKDGYFVPDYERVTLTEESDYETIFLQTGLGRLAVDTLLEKGDFQAILDAQEAFFNPPEAECTALLGWFTREDLYKEDEEDTVERKLVDLQPGDILISLSTHSFGWHHGHAAIVIGGNTTLESVVLGTDSQLGTSKGWCDYSNYAVLRIKDVTPELQQEVVDYSLENLQGVPYHLTSGLIGGKAPEPDSPVFGTQCAYLVWYAWYQMGYDLDSDGGRIVTPHDLLHSDKVEIVQIYGMDPREFVED